MQTAAHARDRRPSGRAANPFTRSAYALLAAAAAAALAAAGADLRLALLPAALVFGWTQIGSV